MGDKCRSQQKSTKTVVDALKKETIDKTIWMKVQLFGREKKLSGPMVHYWEAMNKASYELVLADPTKAELTKKQLGDEAHDKIVEGGYPFKRGRSRSGKATKATPARMSKTC